MLTVASKHVNTTGESVDSNPYNVTFLAGDTSAQFNVSIYGAEEANGTFKFDLIINSSSLPYNIDVGNPGQATVTIGSQCKHNHTLYIILYMYLESIAVMIFLHICIA